MSQLLPLFVAVPLGAAFILPLVGKARGGWLLDVLAILVGAFDLVLSVLAVLDGAPRSVWIGGWGISGGSPLGINLYSDGLASLMVSTISLVTLAALVFSVQYMRRFTGKGLYYSLFFLMVAGMNGVVLTGDLFNLFVFLEVAAVSSYALVAFGCESEELEASFKYLVLGSLGSTLILFGVALSYNLTGTLNMAQIGGLLQSKEMDPAWLLAASFFLAGFALKAAMVPFHAWLPDAHPSAPAPISAMLSGVLIKALGVYALCRVFFNVFGPGEGVFPAVLLGMGALSMVAGVLLAVGQWDFKRLLAYHSISQMGYVVLAAGLALDCLGRAAALEAGPGKTALEATAALALFGGLFHLFNHAAFKSLLFLCAGAAEHSAGTRDLKRLGGLAEGMPVTAFCTRVGALSISGIPPFNGFWSKLVIVLALAQAGRFWLAGMTVLVSFLTLVSFVKVQRYALHGDTEPGAVPLREAPLGMCAAMVLLAAVCLGAGVLCPLIQGSLFEPAREALLGGLSYARSVMGG